MSQDHGLPPGCSQADIDNHMGGEETRKSYYVEYWTPEGWDLEDTVVGEEAAEELAEEIEESGYKARIREV